MLRRNVFATVVALVALVQFAAPVHADSLRDRVRDRLQERKEKRAAAENERRQREEAVPAAGTSAGEIVSGGVTRRYLLHMPPNLVGQAGIPLVLVFHGFGSTAAQQAALTGFSTLADAEGFAVVYPEGSAEGTGEKQQWAFGTREQGKADVRFIRDLVDRLVQSAGVDGSRVFATGISNGAQMSMRLACDMADRIAGVGLVAGGYPAKAECAPTRPVPAIVFHGTADRLLPYEGRPPVMVPVRAFVAGWAKRNGCTERPAALPPQGEVRGEAWSGCSNDARVVLYTVEGKGHSWPGSTMPERITTKDIDATRTVWRFFRDVNPMATAAARR
jgi:polyhydroxybutyrate depolymerase